MYAKLIDGSLAPAPDSLTVDSRTHYHPSAEILTAQGYLPVAESNPPEQEEGDTTVYAASYTEQDGQIVQVWVIVEPVEIVPAVPTQEERIAALEAALLEIVLGG